ncbi:TetR/AcrR family transcriptional regulator [Nocardia otitidiscaviarum]|uniref:TetR/AcrR family transcriptional regulator n=1 Tax=Nocardia otitidiscaviarum TaxID=1823 RepID=A0A516NER7_9NOCA|nr:TetR/AcrR family transcriptional regulator [Nocardia otitidiscaviarum]MCP9622649.1 TetR/AcrR family transcriptional regulator [Nocardia otitidiscaviarum]QDP77396.1 TetR/AcrR family transcriptional regulator [Nocardia otitidiscaviarum]
MNPDTTVPGSIRPGGRTARVREAVLRAAGDLLAEQGFAALDLTEVAARADVGKTTVYRRWRTPTGLIADLLVDMAETSLPHADTGTLAGDLLANARLVATTLTDPRQSRLFTAVIAAATCDPAAAAALRRFYDTRLTEWAPCVTAAIARGEIPVGTDPRALLSAVSAPLYYRLLASGDPIDDSAAVAAADAATAAARAGVFVTPA